LYGIIYFVDLDYKGSYINIYSNFIVMVAEMHERD